MIRFGLCFILLLVPACAASPVGTNSVYFPQAGQGQYVRPEYMNPAAAQRMPPDDICRSRLYLGLVGSHESSIMIAALPSPKRILKPAFDEGFNYQPGDSFAIEPSVIEVRDYVPDQRQYAPSVRTVTDRLLLGPERQDRLTIELDAEGYVESVRCE